VVNGFPTLLAHATPIYNNDLPLSQVIESEDFTKVADQVKKATQRGLILPNTHPRKMIVNMGD
jgi:hypothetical protein